MTAEEATLGPGELQRRQSNKLRRRARFFEMLYTPFVQLALVLRPLLRHLPLKKIEPAFVPVERFFKGALFDCRMCGRCVLSSTGMSCPMTCPKSVRNGPCGGLREGGFCELKADMRCVWLDAWVGAAAMKGGHR
ncbi:MAG: methylenetetrahydrofolate reductase C-terminal domain-containing protein, partial [Sphingomonadales bacterium]